jgi:NAD(P)-dependent dehydrogenase (short-subunit alcohol dehydrogenase family)
MSLKTILVTGSTDGIGRETALQLARMGHKVLVHGRDKDKGARVMDEINRKSCNENLAFYISDFADLTSVVQMAKEIRREQESLDVLIHNAGVFSPKHIITRDGNELTFQVNHLAPFLLTQLLMDLIRSNTPARIVNVASSAHYSAHAAYFDDLNGEKSYNSFSAYSFSKLANILFSNELAKRMESSGITSNSLHPGTIDTNMLRISYGGGGRSVEEGAETPIYLATSNEVDGISGKYFSSKREKLPSDLAQDEELQKNLWEISEDLVKKFSS